MMRWKAWSISRGPGMALSPSPCPLPGGERGIRQYGDGRDLDERALAQEPGHDDAGGGREAPLEELAAHLGGLAVILGGGDVLRGLHDVLEPAARRGQELRELPEDVAGLGRDVAAPDDRAALVPRGRARDEEQVPRTDRGRERVAGGPGARPRDHLVGWHRILLGRGPTSMKSHRPRSRNRWILPVSVFGSWSRNSISRGYWCRPTWVFTTSTISASSPPRAGRPGLRTTYAFTICPRSASGLPTTAASATAGCFRIALSTSKGPIRYPALLITSSARPSNQK